MFGVGLLGGNIFMFVWFEVRMEKELECIENIEIRIVGVVGGYGVV